MGKRRKAREIVLNELYYYEITGDNTHRLISPSEKKGDSEREIENYARRLLGETMKNIDIINEKLKEIIKNWNLNRIAIIDISILRFATAEIIFFPDIPAKVSIDEAVEIAKKFSTENSGSFINGILDKIARGENLLVEDKEKTQK